MQLFMSVLVVTILAHDQFLAGYMEMDIDVIQATLLLMSMLRSHGDTASGNLVRELFKLLHTLSNILFGKLRGLHSIKQYFQWCPHDDSGIDPHYENVHTVKDTDDRTFVRQDRLTMPQSR